MSLGLTTERLWILVQRHIYNSYALAAAPWAGKHIAMLSSNHCPAIPLLLQPSANNKNTPEGSTSTDTPVATTTNPPGPPLLGIYSPPSPLAARNFFWECKDWEAPTTEEAETNAWQQAMISRKTTSGIPEKLWLTKLQELNGPDLFPLNSTWVLRNHTTHEFVIPKGHILRLASRSVRGQVSKKERATIFGFFVLDKVYWGEFQSTGTWAGHQLDIVTTVSATAA